ncbi:MAG: hypothetical protein WDW36_001228 [Sanguina aurantia]
MTVEQPKMAAAAAAAAAAPQPTLWVTALDLEKRLRNELRRRSFWDPDVRRIRYSLAQTYEALLGSQLVFSSTNEVEQCLWKSVYYRPIEEFRSRLKGLGSSTRAAASATANGQPPAVTAEESKLQVQKLTAAYLRFLDEAVAFYKKMVWRLQWLYGNVGAAVEVDASVQNEIEEMSRPAAAAGVDPAALYAALQLSVHRSLIYLGDLCRYQSQVMRNSKPEWTRAVSFYKQAAGVLPGSGHPYNQLAVMAYYGADEARAVYYYFRSLAVSAPFTTARENLLLLFERNRGRRDAGFAQTPASLTPPATVGVQAPGAPAPGLPRQHAHPGTATGLCPLSLSRQLASLNQTDETPIRNAPAAKRTVGAGHQGVLDVSRRRRSGQLRLRPTFRSCAYITEHPRQAAPEGDSRYGTMPPQGAAAAATSAGNGSADLGSNSRAGASSPSADLATRYVRLHAILFDRINLDSFADIHAAATLDLDAYLASPSVRESLQAGSETDNLLLQLAVVCIFSANATAGGGGAAAAAATPASRAFAEVAQRATLQRCAATAALRFGGRVFSAMAKMREGDAGLPAMMVAAHVMLGWLAGGQEQQQQGAGGGGVLNVSASSLAVAAAAAAGNGGGGAAGGVEEERGLEEELLARGECWKAVGKLTIRLQGLAHARGLDPHSTPLTQLPEDAELRGFLPLSPMTAAAARWPEGAELGPGVWGSRLRRMLLYIRTLSEALQFLPAAAAHRHTPGGGGGGGSSSMAAALKQLDAAVADLKGKVEDVFMAASTTTQPQQPQQQPQQQHPSQHRSHHSIAHQLHQQQQQQQLQPTTQHHQPEQQQQQQQQQPPPADPTAHQQPGSSTSSSVKFVIPPSAAELPKPKSVAHTLPANLLPSPSAQPSPAPPGPHATAPASTPPSAAAPPPTLPTLRSQQPSLSSLAAQQPPCLASPHTAVSSATSSSSSSSSRLLQAARTSAAAASSPPTSSGSSGCVTLRRLSHSHTVMCVFGHAPAQTHQQAAGTHMPTYEQQQQHPHHVYGNIPFATHQHSQLYGNTPNLQQQQHVAGNAPPHAQQQQHQQRHESKSSEASGAALLQFDIEEESEVIVFQPRPGSGGGGGVGRPGFGILGDLRRRSSNASDGGLGPLRRNPSAHTLVGAMSQTLRCTASAAARPPGGSDGGHLGTSSAFDRYSRRSSQADLLGPPSPGRLMDFPPHGTVGLPSYSIFSGPPSDGGSLSASISNSQAPLQQRASDLARQQQLHAEQVVRVAQAQQQQQQQQQRVSDSTLGRHTLPETRTPAGLQAMSAHAALFDGLAGSGVQQGTWQGQVLAAGSALQHQLPQASAQPALSHEHQLQQQPEAYQHSSVRYMLPHQQQQLVEQQQMLMQQQMLVQQQVLLPLQPNLLSQQQQQQQQIFLQQQQQSFLQQQRQQQIILQQQQQQQQAPILSYQPQQPPTVAPTPTHPTPTSSYNPYAMPRAPPATHLTLDPPFQGGGGGPPPHALQQADRDVNRELEATAVAMADDILSFMDEEDASAATAYSHAQQQQQQLRAANSAAPAAAPGNSRAAHTAPHPHGQDSPAARAVCDGAVDSGGRGAAFDGGADFGGRGAVAEGVGPVQDPSERREEAGARRQDVAEEGQSLWLQRELALQLGLQQQQQSIVEPGHQRQQVLVEVEASQQQQDFKLPQQFAELQPPLADILRCKPLPAAAAPQPPQQQPPASRLPSSTSAAPSPLATPGAPLGPQTQLQQASRPRGRRARLTLSDASATTLGVGQSSPAPLAPSPHAPPAPSPAAASATSTPLYTFGSPSPPHAAPAFRGTGASPTSTPLFNFSGGGPPPQSTAEARYGSSRPYTFTGAAQSPHSTGSPQAGAPGGGAMYSFTGGAPSPHGSSPAPTNAPPRAAPRFGSPFAAAAASSSADAHADAAAASDYSFLSLFQSQLQAGSVSERANGVT